jgi:hypothetical protein
VNKADMHVGMSVKVFDINGSRLGQPDGGWDGEVTSVRRTQCTIRYGDHYEDNFEIERQGIVDRYGHRSFKTIEQAEESARRSAANGVFRKHHLSVTGYELLPLHKMEAIARILEGE